MEVSKILNVINRIGFVSINTSDPVASQAGKFAVYAANERTVTSGMIPFYIVHIYGGASKEQFENALAQVKNKNNFYIIYERVGFNLMQYPGLNVVRINTPKDFFKTHANPILSVMRERLAEISTEYYIEPEWGEEIPYVDSNKENIKGQVTVIIAGPGQGKTYYSRHLAKSRSRTVPIYIDSTQWATLSKENFSSLWKVVMHSFNHNRVPIHNIDGVEREFIELVLHYNLFKIIFDGFDEYILRNKGAVYPISVVESLSELASTSEADIILTARTSFWNSIITHNTPNGSKELTDENGDMPVFGNVKSGLISKEILPFPRKSAIRYFINRFKGANEKWRISLATKLYDKLSSTFKDPKLSLRGRGFTLNTIGELVRRATDGKLPLDWLRENNSYFGWILSAICLREQERQKLIKVDWVTQIKLLEDFAISSCCECTYDDSFLRKSLVASGLNTEQIEELVGEDENSFAPFRDHPILHYSNTEMCWYFPDPFVCVNLLASRLCALADCADPNYSSIAELTNKIFSNISLLCSDISNAVVEQVRTKYPRACFEHILSIINTLRTSGSGDSFVCHDNRCLALATDIALQYVDVERPPGSLRRDRTSKLISLIGSGNVIKGLHFPDSLVRYNFSGIRFDSCLFDGTLWTNCEFSEDTVFSSCIFVGGNSSRDAKIGLSKFIDIGGSDSQGAYFIDRSRLLHNKIALTAIHVEQDIRMFAELFYKSPSVSKTLLLTEINNSNVSLSPIFQHVFNAYHRVLELDNDGRVYRINEGSLQDLNNLHNERIFTGLFADIMLDVLGACRLLR